MEDGELTFEGVLGAVQALMGESVVAEIETGGGVFLLNVVGVLSADNGMADPYDAEAFDFAIGDSGALSLHRNRFRGASRGDDGEVHISVGDPGGSLVLRIGPFRPAG